MSKTNELLKAIDEMSACGEGLIKTANALRDIFSEQTGPVEETPAPQSDEPKKYTFAEVRKAFSAKSHEGFTEQIRELIKSYGADKLSAVKEEDYESLMAALEGIS